MKELNYFFNSPLANSIGQTLLHSIWQGLLLVAIFLIIQRKMDKAHQKVWLGLSTFALQFVVSTLTLYLLLPQADSAPILNTESSGFSSTFQPILSPEAQFSFFDWVINHSHWLFVGWIFGFSLLLIRQFGGMLYVNYLKNTGLTEASSKVQKAFNSVLEKIEKSDIQIFESSKINTAMVLGHFKPIILVPFSFASGLSQDQLELILAHEIAHVRRNDYIINLIQHLFESLFFYHPAYWLVSNITRENREHACDDWAAEITGKRVLLAKTLAQIQLNNFQPQLAMTFGKTKMTMLNRIQRLLGIAPQQNKMKLTALLLMLATFSTFGFISQKNIEKKEQEQTEIEDQIIPKHENETLIEDIDKIITTKADTNIAKYYDYNFNDEDIRIKTNDYDVRIDQDKILVNGKEQPLSATDKAKLKEHWKGIKENSAEVQKFSKEIQKEAEKISKLHTEKMAKIDFNPQNDPEFQKAMKKIQENSEIISKDALVFQQKMQKLDPKDLNYQIKADQLSKEFEDKVKVNEEIMQNLEGFEEKMKDFEVKIQQDLEIPISKIEAVIQSKEVNIDAYADRLEKHHEELLKLLPEDVQKNIRLDHPERPERPELPERPERPERLERTERPIRPKTPPTPPKPNRVRTEPLPAPTSE